MADVIVAPIVGIPDFDSKESGVNVIHDPGRFLIPNGGESIIVDDFGLVESLEVLCCQYLLYRIQLIVGNQASVASE